MVAALDPATATPLPDSDARWMSGRGIAAVTSDCQRTSTRAALPQPSPKSKIRNPKSEIHCGRPEKSAVRWGVVPDARTQAG